MFYCLCRRLVQLGQLAAMLNSWQQCSTLSNPNPCVTTAVAAAGATSQQSLAHACQGFDDGWSETIKSTQQVARAMALLVGGVLVGWVVGWGEG